MLISADQAANNSTRGYDAQSLAQTHLASSWCLSRHRLVPLVLLLSLLYVLCPEHLLFVLLLLLSLIHI